MAELKTKDNSEDVDLFINSIQDQQKKSDSKRILELMEEVVSEKPRMWGSSIVGFGKEHLKYESGRELDWFKIGFSPRKQNLTFYVLKGAEIEYSELLSKLGKHSKGKGCLYVKTLSNIDENILMQIFKKASNFTQ